MPNYLLQQEESCILPYANYMDDMQSWAKQYPNLYTVYTSGYIVYYDQRALEWFILRWGMPESMYISAVGLG